MKILLIGCGNIGTALLNSWIKSNIINEIVVIQPSLSKKNDFQDNKKIKFVNSIGNIKDKFKENIIVLAVKPQNLDNIITDIGHRNNNAVIISILAGIKISTLSISFPKYNNIIRLMPNIAIKTGNSVNICFTNIDKDNNQIKNFVEIFSPLGQVFFLDKEEQIDELTPIFGCGPAYFLHLCEIMLKNIIKSGIEKEAAKIMLDKLVISVASLVDDKDNYSDIINSISSKGGVTEIALKTIKPQFENIIIESFAKARRKIKELDNENCG